MTGAPATPTSPRRARAATAWALTYTAFGLTCALSGTPLFHLGDTPGPPALTWAAVALGTLSAATGAATTRYGPRPALRGLLWTACALAALAAFGLLMDLITLAFGQGVDHAPAALHHALAATGAVLLAATARPRPSPSPAHAHHRRASVAAWIGTLAFLPYVAMKLTWTAGGTFAGITGDEMLAASRRNGASDLWLTLESWGLDATVLLAALGTLLLWSLVRPWGRTFPRWTPWLRHRPVPRWLPLTPAVLGAATLAPYGLLGLGYAALATLGAVQIQRGDFPTPADALLVTWIGMLAFAGYGLALTTAAHSYWRRTARGPSTPAA